MRVSSPPVGTLSAASDVTDTPNHNSKPRCDSGRGIGGALRAAWGCGCAVGECRVPTAGSATTIGALLPPEVEESEQSQVPETPDHDPREGGFGPGEKGESIEDGRQDKQDEQGSGEQESDDSEKG